MVLDKTTSTEHLGCVAVYVYLRVFTLGRERGENGDFKLKKATDKPKELVGKDST